jgi:hypothetical protein
VFVVGGERILVFVVGCVRLDGVCCWRCKDRWYLLLGV